MFSMQVYKKLERGPQVVSLKDCALVSAFTGLQSGDNVIDAGAGSGFLAIYLASIIAPSGRVFSYEWRDDFVELAKKNISLAGLNNIEVKWKDVFEGIEEQNIDLIALDLANAEKALPHAKNALKKNGFIAGFLPNIEQVKTFVETAGELGLRHDKTIESIVRELLVRSYGTRPQTKGLLHTAFISFLRK